MLRAPNPIRLACAALACGLGLAGWVHAQDTPASSERTAWVVTLADAISPATADYFTRALDDAADAGAPLLVLELDTPGGLDASMRSMIKRILGSPIPVVTYVSPSGARAASAGTYIAYASHVAAMAPATNLGAATPIPVGGQQPAAEPETPDTPAGRAAEEAEKLADKASDESDDSESSDAPPETAASRKAVSDAVAYIRSLAERRDRNADWAEKAVREGVSLSAEAAVEKNVVDLIANNLPELFEQIDGREVQVAGGTVTIDSKNLAIQRIKPDWRVKLLSIITNPTLAYILMMIGIYGLLLEGYSPGSLVPGTVGAICLLLALFAFQVLPINYAGLALIVLGVLLMIAEAFAPSFGVLGLGGIVAFVFGSVLLIDTDVPGYGINRGVIAGIATLGGGLMLATIYLFAKSRSAPVRTSSEGLIGAVGPMNDAAAAGDAGWAVIDSETWQVRPRADVAAGDRVRVTAMDGLTLVVEPISSKEPSS